MINIQKHITYRQRVYVVILFFLLMFSPLVHAQDIVVREIPSLDKLPVNAIHRIFQDSDGYIWYGTFNGLCRNDGYNIRVFRSDLYHPGLLSDNYITYISEDYEKKIWFGTMKGGYILDKATSQITPMDLQEFSDQNVFTINVTKDGNIWVSMRGVLFRFRADGTLVKRYKTEYNHSPEFVYIVYEDKAGDLLISITRGGMYKLNKETDDFEAYFHNEDYMDIERIIWDETNGYYWLGTWGKGIVRFNPDGKTKEEQYIPQPLPVDITGNPTGAIYHMVQDDIFHYIWVTSWKDLFAFRITEKGMLKQVDTSSFLTPGNKILYEIYKDKEGKLWVSSFDVESFIIDIRDYIVKKYPLPDLRNRLKANPAINSLCKEEEDIFWFSQDRYGLCIYDSQKDKLKHYSECPGTRHLPFGDVYDLVRSHSHNRIWAMPYGSTVFGLSQQNLEMKEELRIDISLITKNPGTNTSLFEDSNDNLWIGTTTGLFVYRIKASTLESIPEVSGHVAGITQTADGQIWAVVKNKGIYQIGQNKHIEHYSFNKDFICVDATSDGNLWIGTAEGEVLMFDHRLKEKLTDYSFNCGMKGDIINNITVDIYNHVWITTNQMIKEFNPRNGAYRSYSTRDKNFLLTRLLSHAVYYDKKGEIYFGGISGIVSISPTQQLESIPEQVKTHITDIKIMGKSIWENKLKQNPITTSVCVSPNDQNLEIEFSSLDFHNLDQIRYAYRMVGVDLDWIYLDDRKNSAFYNRLDKGKYIFQVKATDKNGLWSNEITEVVIHRLPAWYETWWAYLIYVLLCAGFLSYCIYIYLKRMKRKNDEKWADSAELVKMHQYLDTKESLSVPEFAEIDKLLLNRATKAVEEHLGEAEFNVVSLAEAMNMSRSTLSRKIKVITGKTPLDFIKDIKMQHACRMLENKTATIADVFTALGYSDYKNFTQSFKEAFGMTPSEYQKQIKEKAEEATDSSR